MSEKTRLLVVNPNITEHTTPVPSTLEALTESQRSKVLQLKDFVGRPVADCISVLHDLKWDLDRAVMRMLTSTEGTWHKPGEKPKKKSKDKATPYGGRQAEARRRRQERQREENKRKEAEQLKAKKRRSKKKSKKSDDIEEKKDSLDDEESSSESEDERTKQDRSRLAPLLDDMSTCPPAIFALEALLKREILDIVDVADSIKVWISCSLPKVEEGGDLSINVLETIGETLGSIEEGALSLLEDASNYHTNRAKMLVKLNKRPMVDLAQSMIELDFKEIREYRDALGDLSNHLLVIYDSIKKNIDRINNPRASKPIASMY
eukprot:gnl/Dysnectes_brevis/1573_a1783_3563.p1 GENE.gnl/Dysnectes_brevis/1573_a1783_3563~~gnl/Dysnectes_brevis/1573_a1783_3563.p1  ORF type:complete len:320 (-),score=117.62 gnl/Dysnectes_brevis/1573_a1783_3563:75-1034(-)